MKAYMASVTFEFDDAAPETVKVQIAAGSPSVACSRAVKAAQKARPNTRFRSLLVLLESKS